MPNVFTDHVVPTCGNLLALVMLLSPFPAVLRIRRTGDLGVRPCATPLRPAPTPACPLTLPLHFTNHPTCRCIRFTQDISWLSPCQLQHRTTMYVCVHFCSGQVWATRLLVPSQPGQPPAAPVYLQPHAEYLTFPQHPPSSCKCLGMRTSPPFAVLHARAAQDMNPLPYPMTCINSVAWVAYGMAGRNPYVFPANCAGFVSGLFFTLTAYPLAKRKVSYCGNTTTECVADIAPVLPVWQCRATGVFHRLALG